MTDRAGPHPTIEPFRFAGGERAGVLLVHGFTGSPEEMRGLGRALAADGLLALGPRLPGHGRPPTPEPNEWTAWRDEVRGALTDLRSALPPGRPVIGIGLSMGSLLVLEQAADPHGALDAVVALAPALLLPQPATAFLTLARHLGAIRSLVPVLPKGPSDIRDPVALAAHPVAEPFPILAALSFDELRRRVPAMLQRVHQPVLTIHGALDRTCLPSGACVLAQGLGSRVVEKHLLPTSGHVITVDRERDVVVRLVREFVERQIALDRAP